VNRSSEKLTLEGGAGGVEALLDYPSSDAPNALENGIAIICHPHPLFGGTMDNKVVQTLARGFLASGWKTLRFNFRGVGNSQGVHDNGVGETSDLLSIIEQVAPSGPIALSGFSFGAFIASHGVEHLSASGRAFSDSDHGSLSGELKKVVLVGTATTRFDVRPIALALHSRTLVIHGEEDDTVPLSSVMDWARPQVLPVTVVPSVGHFFHGQLPLLKSLVVQHLKT
jgi:alpha/beta superfamily hydrolase